MTQAPWTWRHGDGPIIAAAIHAGHDLRDDVEAISGLDGATRRREEDPFTDRWTACAPTAVIVHRSRFEVDVNRPRHRSVYLQPEDCWNLRPWSKPPSPDLVAESTRLYDAFYDELQSVCTEVADRYGAFVLLDLHSYNHRRLGPGGPAADPEFNPEVNVGTAALNRGRWGGLIDGFLRDLRDGGLDARENVRFRGARLAAWTSETFPETGCCLAVDVKKVYMDEHSGTPDPAGIDRIRDVLTAAVPRLVRALSDGAPAPRC